MGKEPVRLAQPKGKTLMLTVQLTYIQYLVVDLESALLMLQLYFADSRVVQALDHFWTPTTLRQLFALSPPSANLTALLASDCLT